MLSDPKLRTAYDSRGKEAVDAAPKMDAGTLPITHYILFLLIDTS